MTVRHALVIALLAWAEIAWAAPVQRATVVKAYPHDRTAFTQGLFVADGRLYESTGQYGESSLRAVDLATGRTVRRVNLPPQVFGEGSTAWKDRVVVLTWTTGVGFELDRATFDQKRVFRYAGEGWGLTSDGRRLILSDGSANLRFFDPDRLVETGRVIVTDGQRPVPKLNELEWVRGEVWANVWQTDRIARIDPRTGKVKGWIDLSGLLAPAERGDPADDVLNGIAWDAKSDRIYVTGKRWPKLFEIKVK